MTNIKIQIKGVAEAAEMIRKKGKDIVDGKDAVLFQIANFLQQEIQESIEGNRAEERSVDTGNFGNSIAIEKNGLLSYSVYTDVEYAKFLEYGTSYMSPRMHFRNSLNRNKVKMILMSKKG